MRDPYDAPRWRRYLRFFGPNVDGDIDDELRYHIDMRRHDFIARGYSPERADAAVRELFGDVSTVRRALREHDRRALRHMRRADMLQDLAQDLRYGVRQLRNAPRFTLTVVLVLALGIGANTAVFSAIDAAFLRGLPFPHPEQLVSLTGVDLRIDPLDFPMAGSHPPFEPSIADYLADSSAFQSAAAYAAGGLNLTGGAQPVRANVVYVTDGFFRALERAPLAGRLPSDVEYQRNGPRVIVLSYSLWQEQFGGDRSIVGRTVSLNDSSYVVTGIMPRDFRFPANADLWIPMPVPYPLYIMSAFRNFVPSKFIARLKPGLTLAQAAQHADAIRHRYPVAKRDTTPAAGLVPPLQRTLVGDRRTSLLILMSSAALLLLIACANVTNLLLSRASLRRRELAVRVVLGATRSRVLRQLIVESILLSLAGGIVAVVVARVSLGALTAALPVALAGVAPPKVDVRVLAFTFALATVTSMLFGLWPAIGASRPNLGDAMKLGAGATRKRGAGARGVFVVAEISVALMLLIGAGLMIQSLRTLLQVDTGMHPDHVVTARMTIGRRHAQQQRAEFLRDIVHRLEATPGVSSAAIVSALPMEGAGGIALRVSPEDAPKDESRMAMGAYLMASPGFFKTMGVSLRGEDLPDQSDPTRPVVVINESMAKKMWPHEDAIGRRIAFGNSYRTVIGVVANIRNSKLEDQAMEQMYWPISEAPESYASIVVRGTSTAASLTARIRDVVHAVDPLQPVYALRTMDDVISATVAPRRTNTLLLTIFGAVALVLAGVGVYGVLSYGVAQRTREIGVRIALGAQRGDVVRLIVQQGALLTVSGTIIGLAAAYALSKFLASVLYEVSPHDPFVFILAPLVLASIALLGVSLPAVRATRVDAITALREE